MFYQSTPGTYTKVTLATAPGLNHAVIINQDYMYPSILPLLPSLSCPLLSFSDHILVMQAVQLQFTGGLTLLEKGSSHLLSFCWVIHKYIVNDLSSLLIHNMSCRTNLGTPETLITAMPTGGHSTRSLAFTSQGLLLVQYAPSLQQLIHPFRFSYFASFFFLLLLFFFFFFFYIFI